MAGSGVLIAPANALVAAAIALGALALRWQERHAPDTTAVVMVPATAFGILLAACSLLLLRASHDAARQGIGRFAAVVTAVLGLAIAGQYLAEWQFGDASSQLFGWSHAWARRPSPTTSVGLTLVGVSIVALSMPRVRSWADIGASATLLVALVGLVGHAYGASVYGLRQWGGTAVSTAVALGALALGVVFAQPSRGVAAVVLGDSPGGQLLRRLLPAALLAALLIGWIALAAQRAGLSMPNSARRCSSRRSPCC